MDKQQQQKDSEELFQSEVRKYTLADIVKEVDKLEPGELNFDAHPDVLRFKIAKWLFWSCIVLIAFSWVQNLFVPEWLISNCVNQSISTERLLIPSCDSRYQRLVLQSENIFEFAKTWIPPLLGVVVGFYFTSNGQNGNVD